MTTWPPYSRLVAATWFKSATITILDGATLTPLNGVPWRLPQSIKDGRHWLSFSPDSRFLTDGKLTSRDLQTGGPIGTIPPGPHKLPDRIASHPRTPRAGGHSRLHAGIFLNTPPSPSLPTVSSLRHTYSLFVPKGNTATPLLTHGEYLRFATVGSGSITIWEVEFTLLQTLEKVWSMSAPNKFACGEKYMFLPTLS